MPAQVHDTAPIYSSFAADEMMAELVELFVSEIPDRVQTLREAYATSNQELLRRTAHQLKGAFGSYGFDEMTPPARELESALDKNASPEEVLQLIENLVSYCQRMTAVPAP